MFKSLFAKYISAFMLIIFFSFAVIIAIITSIINSYSQQAKKDMMITSAVSAQNFLSTQEEITNIDDLSDLFATYPDEINTTLESIASASEDITMIISDESGYIISVIGDNSSEIKAGDYIPPDFTDIIGSVDNNEFFWTGEKEDFFNKPHIIYPLPLTDEAGQTDGTIYVCATTVILQKLLEVIIKSIVLAILWVMLATLIAVYFISEQDIELLKRIGPAP